MNRNLDLTEVLWLGLMLLSGVLVVLYLWFALVPGAVDPAVFQFFSAGQVERGRAYAFVPRLLYVLNPVIQGGFLGWLVFSSHGRAFAKAVERFTGGSYWVKVFGFALFLWLALLLLRLPISIIRGYTWPHAWGLSTQTISSWWVDYAKSVLLDLPLTLGLVLGFSFTINRFPRGWWAISALAVSIWLIIQNLLWPVIISPMFNHFEAAKDAAIVDMVHGLAAKAGIPVDQVLVMDASRRTTTVNAYFTGLGRTKRIVLYDNLLKYPFDEVKAVVAHEMGHWQKRHLLSGLVLGILGNFFVFALMHLALRPWVSPIGWYGLRATPPSAWAVVQLFFLLAILVSNPIQNAVSRVMEREADQVALSLTGDVAAQVRLQVDLATKNLADLSPPPYMVWFSYTHPTALERIKAAEGQ